MPLISLRRLSLSASPDPDRSPSPPSPSKMPPHHHRTPFDEPPRQQPENTSPGSRISRFLKRRSKDATADLAPDPGPRPSDGLPSSTADRRRSSNQSSHSPLAAAAVRSSTGVATAPTTVHVPPRRTSLALATEEPKKLRPPSLPSPPESQSPPSSASPSGSSEWVSVRRGPELGGADAVWEHDAGSTGVLPATRPASVSPTAPSSSSPRQSVQPSGPASPSSGFSSPSPLATVQEGANLSRKVSSPRPTHIDLPPPSYPQSSLSQQQPTRVSPPQLPPIQIPVSTPPSTLPSTSAVSTSSAVAQENVSRSPVASSSAVSRSSTLPNLSTSSLASFAPVTFPPMPPSSPAGPSGTSSMPASPRDLRRATRRLPTLSHTGSMTIFREPEPSASASEEQEGSDTDSSTDEEEEAERRAIAEARAAAEEAADALQTPRGPPDEGVWSPFVPLPSATGQPSTSHIPARSPIARTPLGRSANDYFGLRVGGAPSTTPKALAELVSPTNAPRLPRTSSSATVRALADNARAEAADEGDREDDGEAGAADGVRGRVRTPGTSRKRLASTSASNGGSRAQTPTASTFSLEPLSVPEREDDGSNEAFDQVGRMDAPRPVLTHHVSRSLINLSDASTRRMDLPSPSFAIPTSPPPPLTPLPLSESPTAWRRMSLPNLSAPPPKYFQTYARPEGPQAVYPREEEGREPLPAYHCSIHIEGLMPRKMEFSGPGLQARDRSWRRVYAILHGTVLRIYKADRWDPDSGASEVSDLSDADQDAVHVHPPPPPDAPVPPVPTLPQLLAHAHSNSQPNPLVKTYTLQNAESGLAADYFKRKNVIRVRCSSDGDPQRTEQFLIQASDQRGVVDWIEALQAATNVSLDLETRPMPKIITLPRRRRRRRRPDPAQAAANAERARELAGEVGLGEAEMERLLEEEQEALRRGQTGSYSNMS